MKWHYFVFACFLTSMLVIQAGAPLPAVALGVGSAFLLNWRKHRNILLKAQGKASARR
jgi:hypothetical protein